MFPVNFEYSVDIAKAYEEEGRWIVEGYAATTDFDLQDDIITEEAIQASAKDLLENSTVLHNHNPDEAIGKVVDSKAAKGGLFLKIMISKTAPEIWQQVKEGVLNKFSVRGRIIDARKEWVAEFKRDVRKIYKMQLVEVSLVAVPANPKARAVRWYVEKALDEFEKAGGSIAALKGGREMNGEEEVVEEELIEGSEDPGEKAKNDAQDAAGGPDAGKSGPETGKAEQVVKSQEAGPGAKQYPYPYPKPAAGCGIDVRRIVEIADTLLAGENDEGRKKLLQEIRDIANSAAYPYPYPAAKKEKPGKKKPGDEEQVAEKAGGDVPQDKLVRLKKLLEELKSIVGGTDAEAPDEAKPQGDPDGKVTQLETALADMAKRLEGLEKAPGVKTSIDGQEELPGEKKSKALWKGLV